MSKNAYITSNHLPGIADAIKEYVKMENDKITGLIPIKYKDLVALRNTESLKPGFKYRITDYETTTAQENTKSAGHPFDVIVEALDESTLSENASAIRREDDDYFETENLEAWQLKYCLDNDTERFAWADNRTPEWYSKIVANYVVDQSGTQTYSLDKEAYIYDYGSSLHPDTGEDTLAFWTADPIYFEESGADYTDTYYYNGITTVDGVEYDSWRKFSDSGWVYAESDEDGLFALTERVVFDGEFVWPDLTGTEIGKGVIYNMIDEYGNECPYDFKNIKFHHDGLGTDVYTFTWIDENYEVMDTSVFGNNGTLTYYSEIKGVYGNVIKPYMEMIYEEDSGSYLIKHSLNNLTFISDYEYAWNGNDGFYGCYSNSFGNNCYSNSFGNNCYSNSFGNNCYSNNFGDYCNYNTFGNECYNNTFGNECYNNTFGNYCFNNSLGNYYYSNSFGNACQFNSFRLTASKTGTLLNNCHYNHFDDGCSFIVIWNSVQPTSSNRLQNINVVRGVSGKYSAYNFINIVDKNADYEIKVAKNSRGEIKIYCEADLIK